MLATLRAEWQREEAKHAIGSRWRGRVEGIIAGIVIISLAFTVIVQQMQREAFRQAREIAQAGVMMGVASQARGDRPLEATPEYERNRREPPDAAP